MNEPAAVHPINDLQQALQDRLESQRKAFWSDMPVSAELRIDRIDRAIALLVDHEQELCAAMDADFQGRPVIMSRFADVMSAVNHLKHARNHVRRWMKRERRSVRFPMGLLGARAWVQYQPLGVVGVISPWNYPVLLTFGPLGGVLAAGNRCMIKPSENTPETSETMKRLFAQAFDPDEIDVVTGGPDVGQAFSALPFDHMLFTGATSVGRHIMRAAADNLTPVTLELGGKSPTIIGESADLDETALKIVNGKLLNAGQTCLAPDYLFVPEGQVDPLIEAVGKQVHSLFPKGSEDAGYTAIVNDNHHRRLQSYLDELSSQAVRIERFGDDAEPRRLAFTLVVEPPEDSALMREEIFGPILPIKSYRSLDEVIDYIRSHERPLGLYYFGKDDREVQRVLDSTIAGGVTINDVLFHISVDDLPFGGVGQSGMGAYHGIEGFRAFSHAKAVFRQSPFNLAGLIGLIPPWGKKLERTLKMELKK